MTKLGNSVAAALLGTSGGMRSMLPLAALAAGGQLTRNRGLRTGLILAAAGELVGDKLPNAPSRTMPVAVMGRAGAGGIAGLRTAGALGGAIAAGTAIASTFISHDLRAAAVRRTGLPDLPIALIEDALAVGLAVTAVRLAGDGPGAPPPAPR